MSETYSSTKSATVRLAPGVGLAITVAGGSTKASPRFWRSGNCITTPEIRRMPAVSAGTPRAIHSETYGAHIPGSPAHPPPVVSKKFCSHWRRRRSWKPAKSPVMPDWTPPPPRELPAGAVLAVHGHFTPTKPNPRRGLLLGWRLSPANGGPWVLGRPRHLGFCTAGLGGVSGASNRGPLPG